MFRMDEYLEKWATKYKPISHQPEAGSKGKRFYRLDSITSVAPFLANLVNVKTSSMGYITQVDGVLAGNSEKFLMKEHRVFFFVKQQGIDLQNGITEELAATDAKHEGAEMAEDLLAYLIRTTRKETRTWLASTSRERPSSPPRSSSTAGGPRKSPSRSCPPEIFA